MLRDVLVSIGRRESGTAWQAVTFLLRAVVGEPTPPEAVGAAQLVRVPLELDVELVEQGTHVARLREARTGYLPRSVELLREAVGRGLRAMLLEETEHVGYEPAPATPPPRRPTPRGRRPPT
jgi:hypothetical protein